MSQIRSVRASDREAWLRMRHSSFGGDVREHGAEIDRFLAGEAREPLAVLVAEQEGCLLGLAELSIRACAEGCDTERVGYLEGWWVEPEARGRGIGRSLVEAAEEWSRSQGCREFASDTRADNEASRRAHLACGFEDAGLVRCFRKSL